MEQKQGQTRRRENFSLYEVVKWDKFPRKNLSTFEDKHAYRLAPNKRLRIDDAILAGQNVEPRILEVLPAAVLRLGRHFDLDPGKHADLTRTVTQLRTRQDRGEEFQGIPYTKLKVWAEIPFPDRRVKPAAEKKVTKTFRLHPPGSRSPSGKAQVRRTTETAILESLITERRR
jgi:hypothetical protein